MVQNMPTQKHQPRKMPTMHPKNHKHTKTQNNNTIQPHKQRPTTRGRRGIPRRMTKEDIKALEQRIEKLENKSFDYKKIPKTLQFIISLVIALPIAIIIFGVKLTLVLIEDLYYYCIHGQGNYKEFKIKRATKKS